VSEREPVRRVVQLHTRYREPGGEDQVVAAEKRLLEEAGVEVEQVIFDNAELRESRSPIGDLRLAAGAVWSRAAERRVRTALRAHRAQVMHVHNTFVAASPSVYAAAMGEGVPVVQTLHNYRLICPAATAYRDGHPCTDCVGRAIPWPAVAHACYRGSRAQSLSVAATIAIHRGLGTFARRIDAYLALSEFQRGLLVRGGLPAERIRVLPNFLEPDPGVGDEARSGLLYVGRLADEKGVGTLLRAAAIEPREVRVAGDGPLAPVARESAAAGHIQYLGALDRPAVLDELRHAIALLVPSEWFEGFPMVVLEAFATGTPVIASRIGSLAELVEDGVTGVLVGPGEAEALAGRMRWARDHPDEMAQLGANARRRYETQYRGAAHLAALLETYEGAIDRAGRTQDA
jgi:glycosyltransferase involved in cell wall biosynthesis